VGRRRRGARSRAWPDGGDGVVGRASAIPIRCQARRRAARLDLPFFFHPFPAHLHFSTSNAARARHRVEKNCCSHGRSGQTQDRDQQGLGLSLRGRAAGARRHEATQARARYVLVVVTRNVERRGAIRGVYAKSSRGYGGAIARVPTRPAERPESLEAEGTDRAAPKDGGHAAGKERALPHLTRSAMAHPSNRQRNYHPGPSARSTLMSNPKTFILRIDFILRLDQAGPDLLVARAPDL